MLWNRRNRTIHKGNIERKNFLPYTLSGLGGVPCGICSFVVDASTLIKQRGIWVCSRCWDGDPEHPRK